MIITVRSVYSNTYSTSERNFPMKKNREKSPVFLYIIIVILALIILALGGVTLMSLNDLAFLRSKVSSLQDTVQEISDTSADLLAQADELTSLKEQSASSETAEPAPDSSTIQEEGTISPSHSEPTTSTDDSMNSLLSQIQPLLPQNNGSWSVYVCNLIKNTEGNIYSHPMQAASLIKLYIMGAVYENYETLLQTYSADTLNNYLNPMITVSDNDAANALVEILGNGDTTVGMAAVNTFCQNHGFTDTSMGRLLLQSNENGDNYTSANDCGRFLKEIYQTYNNTSSDGTLAHADAMYGLLKMQERRNKIPADMPEGVNVANKTGELDTVENDAGIIYNTAKGIDLVICFMSENLSDTGNAQAVIAQDSRMIYGYYNE